MPFRQGHGIHKGVLPAGAKTPRYASIFNLTIGDTILGTTIIKRFITIKVDPASKKRKLSNLRKSKVVKPVDSKSNSLKGQIGNINVSIYLPFYYKLLPNFKQELIKEALEGTVKAHDSLISNHGVKDGTRRWKQLTSYSINVLEGKNPPNPGWVSTSKINKWPKKFGHLRTIFVYIKDNIKNKENAQLVANSKRFILNLFKLNRIKTDYSELDVTNIKRNFKIPSEVYNSFENFARKRLSVIPEMETDLTALPIFGSANGPNALPKLESADSEAFEIIFNNENIKRYLFDLIDETDNFGFKNYLEVRAQTYKDSLESKAEELKGDIPKIFLRKLQSIPDRGNKSRTIAICDYWTQSILAPIEKYVLYITKRLYSKNIAFYGHSEGWNKILQLENKETYVSLDATEWTDNLPSGLQYIVLKILLGQNIAQA